MGNSDERLTLKKRYLEGFLTEAENNLRQGQPHVILDNMREVCLHTSYLIDPALEKAKRKEIMRLVTKGCNNLLRSIYGLCFTEPDYEVQLSQAYPFTLVCVDTGISASHNGDINNIISPPFRRFVKSGGVGILSYDEAIRAMKKDLYFNNPFEPDLIKQHMRVLKELHDVREPMQQIFDLYATNNDDAALAARVLKFHKAFCNIFAYEVAFSDPRTNKYDGLLSS